MMTLEQQDLIAACYPLARRLAHRYPDHRDDLIQVGMLGAIKGLATYRPELGSFRAYASIWIRKAQWRYWRDETEMVRARTPHSRKDDGVSIFNRDGGVGLEEGMLWISDDGVGVAATEARLDVQALERRLVKRLSPSMVRMLPYVWAQYREDAGLNLLAQRQHGVSRQAMALRVRRIKERLQKLVDAEKSAW